MQANELNANALWSLPADEAIVVESPVSSHNEWDPLEEVIVGIVDGATVPGWDDMLEVTMPSDQ